MLMLTGLERVAEELMGRRRWRQYQKLVLREEDDCSMEAKDWEPEDNYKLCVDPPHLPRGEDPSLPTVSNRRLSITLYFRKPGLSS